LLQTVTVSLTIQTKNLVKKYGSRTVVNNVSFNVKQGEIVGLLGPNGAGKTTSFYQVVGLVKPDSGDVLLNDINITKLPMYKRAKMGIGYLPQEASVFRKLSVEDNISAVLEMTKLKKQAQKEKLELLLDEFRLQHVRKNNGDTLSGGERRRTEIARALAVDPKFVLLDEPFAGVDPIAVEDIQAIVAKLKFRNIGILITDHNVNETLSICDRAYLLIDGKIFKHGTAEELADDEQVRRLYLGRNFELKRKDYLHDEAASEDKSSNSEIQPDKLSYSVGSAVQMIDNILAAPITAINVKAIANNDVLNAKDLFQFISELKPALVNYGNAAQLPKVSALCNKIPVLKAENYKPNSAMSLLGQMGSAATILSYSAVAAKLEEDLRVTKSHLSNIKLMIDNPAFADAVSV
jgi:lipopolysaccharide export system ATP-binding protein